MFKTVRKFTKASATEYLKSLGLDVITTEMSDCPVGAVIKHPKLHDGEQVFIYWEGFKPLAPLDSFTFKVSEHLWALPKDMFLPGSMDPDCLYMVALTGMYKLKKNTKVNKVYDRLLEQLKQIQVDAEKLRTDNILKVLD